MALLIMNFRLLSARIIKSRINKYILYSKSNEEYINLVNPEQQQQQQNKQILAKYYTKRDRIFFLSFFLPSYICFFLEYCVEVYFK